MSKRLIIGILVTCLFGAAIVAVTSFHKQYEENLKMEEQQKQKEEADTLRQHRQQLADNIALVVRQDDTTAYSVYLDYLDGTAPIQVQPQRMRAASMINVFILAKAMEDERDGLLDPNQEIVIQPGMRANTPNEAANWPDGKAVPVSELLRQMITKNDNTATNIMIDLLGMDRINEYIKDEGYTDTVLQRKMMDQEALAAGKDNFTSAKDLGIWFKKVYWHDCVDAAHDEQMRQLFLQQANKDGLPNALSSTHHIAHETGTLDGLYHDGGIVYTPAGDYVICILTDKQQSAGNTLRIMQQIVNQAENGL